MKQYSLALSFLAALTLSSNILAAEHWPQWRGPLGTGAAPDANPPTTWSESSNLKWKVRIPGDGTSTPLAWDNKVFVQTAVPASDKTETSRQPYQFVLLCLDRATGKPLWQKVAREEVPHEGVRDKDGSFGATSGVTDGQNVYAFFGSRGLYCYTFEGSLVWTQDFGRMRVKNGFGEGTSPALFKDSLVVNWDNEDGSFITALDKNTGKTLWKEKREEATTWSTPLIVEQGGKVQVVTSGSRRIRSYDLATGKLLWECKGLTANVIPSPVADREKVYCMSGFGGSALDAIRLDRTGDLTGTDAIVWTHNQGTPYVPSPLLYQGRLYFYRVNNPRLTCLDTASGKAFFEAEQVEGLGGMVYASPVGAAGRIYLTDRNGTTVVLKQADNLQILATNKLDDHIDASPVAVGNELFLRGRQYLYCLSEKK